MRLQTLLYSLMSFQTKRYSSLNKEYSDLGKIVRVYDQYKGLLIVSQNLKKSLQMVQTEIW